MNNARMTPISDLRNALLAGPVAIIVNEDDVELATTIRHHQRLGFDAILLIGATGAIPDGCIAVDVPLRETLAETVNPLLPELAGRWVYICYNGEFLIYPFFENRTIRDVVQFMEEERRDAMYCTTLDLYMPEIDRKVERYDIEEAQFDRIGYYSNVRFDGPEQLDRQPAVYGGLRWRFAQHVPLEKQSIDRIALFQIGTSTQLNSLGRLTEPDRNTISCPWHNNVTAAVASWRVAKSLIRNPGSTFEIETFYWPGSEKFDWSSEQLLSLGLIEPGQWF